jgi:hypothetical protein
MALVRAAILALATVLAALAPQPARAHGEHEHASVPAGLPQIAAEVAPRCPPGEGHVCSCGNLPACEGRGKLAVAAAPAAPLAVIVHADPETPTRAAPPRSRPSLCLAFPRAPPPFS